MKKMKTFGYAVTVLLIVICAPVIDWMMEDGGASYRTLGLLLVFALAGIFNLIQKLSEK